VLRLYPRVNPPEGVRCNLTLFTFSLEWYMRLIGALY